MRALLPPKRRDENSRRIYVNHDKRIGPYTRPAWLDTIAGVNALKETSFSPGERKHWDEREQELRAMDYPNISADEEKTHRGYFEGQQKDYGK